MLKLIFSESTDKDIKLLILQENGKTNILLLKECLTGKSQEEIANNYDLAQNIYILESSYIYT